MTGLSQSLFDNKYKNMNLFRMNTKQKKTLYESIMAEVAVIVKKAINEYNIGGVEVKSMKLTKIGDITDFDKPVKFEHKKIQKIVEDILAKMHKDFRFKTFINENMADKIDWTYQIDTAATDGNRGMLMFNPEFAEKIYNTGGGSLQKKDLGELCIQFVILHEAMHNYYHNTRHEKQINSVYDNIQSDKRINAEIIRKWPIFKEIPQLIGALL